MNNLTLSSLCMFGATLPGSLTGQQKPNIVLILADDMGYADTGMTGCLDIPTPNLDRLARSGVRCTSGYITAPYSSPSRAGLLTGRCQTRFGHEFNSSNLPLTETTMADRLRAAGYTTGMVGKWHLGNSHPLDRGFDEFFGFLGGGHRYFTGDGQGSILRGREKVEVRSYLTDVFADEAAAFIGRHIDSPWFLYLAPNAVHDPMQANPEDMARALLPATGKRKTYIGMVVALDNLVGSVLEKLRSTGQEERTMIVFLTDNGGPVSDSLNTNVNGSRNYPFRGGKRQLLEGGIRTPFFVTWKGKLPAGQTYDQPVSSLDLLPTVLAVVGADRPDKLEGVNLLPYLTGREKTAPVRTLCWRFGRQMAVREGEWKLSIWKDDTGKIFTRSLYNVVEDPGETRDLASSQPDRVKHLWKTWSEWNTANIPPQAGTKSEMEEAQTGPI